MSHVENSDANNIMSRQRVVDACFLSSKFGTQSPKGKAQRTPHPSSNFFWKIHNISIGPIRFIWLLQCQFSNEVTSAEAWERWEHSTLFRAKMYFFDPRKWLEESGFVGNLSYVIFGERFATYSLSNSKVWLVSALHRMPSKNLASGIFSLSVKQNVSRSLCQCCHWTVLWKWFEAEKSIFLRLSKKMANKLDSKLKLSHFTS